MEGDNLGVNEAIAQRQKGSWNVTQCKWLPVNPSVSYALPDPVLSFANETATNNVDGIQVLK